MNVFAVLAQEPSDDTKDLELKADLERLRREHSEWLAELSDGGRAEQ